MPRLPLGRPDALGKDGAAATPVPTPLRASRPLPELNDTAASSRKSGAQPGVSPLPPPKAPASRHPSGFPGSLRPSAPATPPCGAPRNPQGAARGSGRLPAGRAHRALPPLSGTSAPQPHGRAPGSRMRSGPWSCRSRDRGCSVGENRRLRRPWPDLALRPVSQEIQRLPKKDQFLGCAPSQRDEGAAENS